MNMNHTPLPEKTPIASLLALCLSLGLASPGIAQTPVTDTTPPVIEYLSRDSTDHTTHSTTGAIRHLNTGDTLTITINSSEPLLESSLANSAEFQINGEPRPSQNLIAQLLPGSNTYSATYTVSDGDNGSPQLIITGVTDAAGNIADTTTHEIPEDEKVIIDTAPPTVSFRNQIPVGEVRVGSIDYLKARSAFAVFVDTNEHLLEASLANAATFRIGGVLQPPQNLEITVNLNRYHTGRYEIKEGNNGIPELIISGIMDIAGNEPTADTVLSIQNVLIDATSPTVTLTGKPAITITIGEIYIDEGAIATDVSPTNAEPDFETVITNQRGDTIDPNQPLDTSGAEIYTYTYTATDLARNSAEATRTVTIARTAPEPPSTDADLGRLIFSQGALTPAFVSTTDSYTASVANTVESITVTPTPANSNARLMITTKVDTNPISNGATSNPINLNVGDNIITITVTAEDTITTKVYTLTITRAAPITLAFSTEPALSSSNPGNYAKDADTLTLTFALNQALRRIPDVTIAGQVATVVKNTRNNYIATYIVIPEDVTDDTQVTYDIGEMIAVAGTDNILDPPLVTSGFQIDITPPTISTSSNTTTGETIVNTLAYLNAVDTLTVNITFSEPLLDTSLAGAATFRIGGVPQSPQNLVAGPSGPSGPPIYSVIHTIRNGQNGAVDTIELIISGVTDVASNELTETIPVPGTVIDTTRPTITLDPLATTGGRIANGITYLNTGDTITVFIQVSEPLRIVTGSTPEPAFQLIPDSRGHINSSNQRLSPSSDGLPNRYQGTYRVQAGDSTGPSINVSVVRTRDLAGNRGTNETFNRSSAIDTALPEITLNGDRAVTLTIGSTYTDPGARLTDISPTNEDPTSTTVITDSDGNITDPTLSLDTSRAEVYTYTYTATDRAGNTAETTRRVIVTDGSLSSLIFSEGTLTPAFDPAVISYTANVGNAVASITITPTTADDGATLTINTNPATSGDISDAIDLNVGDNTITITVAVTVEGAAVTKVYTLVITRSVPTKPTLSGLNNVNINENSSPSVTTITAVLSTGRTIGSFTLGGTDKDAFSTTNTDVVAEVMFTQLPDYEVPTDADGINIYNITIIATDSTGESSEPFAITVTVINVDETGTTGAITGIAQVGEILTAGMVSDPDNVVDITAYEWQNAKPGEEHDPITGATSETYTPGASDRGKTIQVVITYTDGEGRDKTATSPPTIAVPNPPISNAGDDQTVTIGDIVTLTGLDNSEPDDATPTFLWVQDTGTPVTFSSTSATGADAEFTAPDTPGALTFTLTVTNLDGMINTDTVTITVRALTIAFSTEPSLSSSNSGNYAKDGDILTLTFTLNQALTADPSVTIAGQTAIVEKGISNDYTATYTVIAANVTDNTAVTYSIEEITALVGTDNTLAPLTATSSIQIDVTPPTITLNGNTAIMVNINRTHTDEGAQKGDDSDTLETVITDSGGNIIDLDLPLDTSTDEVYTYTYTATDPAGNTATVTRTVTIAESTDANLGSLALPTGTTLIPAFISTREDYTASVGYLITSITVTPTTADDDSKVTVNDNPVTNGDASDPINLNIGTTPITIIVTAQDGTTTETYIVTVTRTPATLSDLDGDSSSVSLNDVKILFYVYELGLTLGDTTDLVSALGPLTSIEDSNLGDLLIAEVTDLNLDGDKDTEDAAILYYSFTLEASLGDGTRTNPGIAEIKKTILGSFITDPNDMDAINQMLESAYTLRSK